MRNLGLLQSLVLTLLVTGPVLAQEIGVRVDGEVVHFNGQPPVLVNARVLIPLRGVFEQMGASVVWHPEKQTVTTVRGQDSVRLKIGSPSASVNGIAHTLDVPAQIRQGRTMVPLRFIGESLGASVLWNAEEKLVLISSSDSDKDEAWTGFVRAAQPSIYMQGTHRLEDSQGQLQALLSVDEGSDINLDDYIGQRVRIKGKAEATVEGNMTFIRVRSVQDLP